MATSTSLRFLNNRVCPFGQRVWLTLLETGLPFELVEVSIAKGTKAAAFTEAYKRALGADPASDGKVPVLEEVAADGSLAFSVTESAVVADFVAARAGALLPATPAERARAGIWAEQVVAPFVKAFYALLMHKEAAGAAEKADALTAAVRAAGAALAPCGGPFLLGARLSTADLLLYPFVARLVVNKVYRGFELPADEAGPDFARFNAWKRALDARPSAAATKQDDAFFVEQYKSYAT